MGFKSDLKVITIQIKFPIMQIGRTEYKSPWRFQIKLSCQDNEAAKLEIRVPHFLNARRGKLLGVCNKAIIGT